MSYFFTKVKTFLHKCGQVISSAAKKLFAFLSEHKGRTIAVLALFAVFFALRIVWSDNHNAEYVYARGISRGYLFLTSSVSNLFSFSLSDFAYAFIVLFALASLVLFIIMLCKKKFLRAGKYLYNAFLLALIIVVGFNLTFTGLYKRESVLSHLELDTPEMTLELTESAARYYVAEASALSENLPHDENGSVISPYTFSELSDLVAEEVYKLTRSDDYFSSFNLKAKPMLFSRIMSYAGFSGVNFPLLGEANINTDTPAYTLPEVIAHEFAHLVGVIPENEASLFAVYVLIQSDNDYLRYAALMSAQNSMLSELYGMRDTDERYNNVAKEVSKTVWREYAYSNSVWAQYENPLDKITEFLNDRYLKSSGLPSGTRSYSETGKFYAALYNKLIGG